MANSILEISTADFSNLANSSSYWPPEGSFILGIDVADKKLKSLDSYGVVYDFAKDVPANGLTQNANHVELGGTLSKATYIDINTNSFNFFDGERFIVDFKNSTLYNAVGVASIDWNYRTLYSQGGTVTATWGYTLQTSIAPEANDDVVNKLYADSKVPQTRTISINGSTLDLTADVDFNISSLPDFTGNTGKFLSNDGTDAVWSDINFPFYTNGTGISLSSGEFSLDLTRTSSDTVTGLLSSSDWTTFNNKFDTPSGTNSQYITGDGSIINFPSFPTNLDSLTDISLSSVLDNQALIFETTSNTWKNKTITSVGTIGTGVWQGTSIADAYIASAATWNGKLGGTLTNNYIPKSNGSGGLIDSFNYEDSNYFYNTKNGFRTNTALSVALLLETTGGSSTSSVFLKSAGAKAIQALNNASAIQWQIYDLSGQLYVESNQSTGLTLSSVGGTGSHYISIRNAGNTYYNNATHTFLNASGTQIGELNASGLAIGSATINASTQLDLQSTTKGLGLNLVPTASLPTASTRKGNLLFDSTSNTLKVSDGTSWVTPLIQSGGTLTGALNEAPSVTLASDSTVNIFGANSSNIIITGTTTITSFDTAPEGIIRWVRFANNLTLTNNANILLLNNSNLTVKSGEVCIFKSDGAGVTRLMQYNQIMNGVVAYTDAPTFANGRWGVSPLTYGTSYEKARFTANASNNFTEIIPGVEDAVYFSNTLRGGYKYTANLFTFYATAGQSVRLSYGGAGVALGDVQVSSGFIGHYHDYHVWATKNYTTSTYATLDTNGLVLGNAALSGDKLTINASAQLDLQSTTKGLGLNLVPTASLPTASTRKGNLLFDSTADILKVSDGINWISYLAIPTGLTTDAVSKWNGSAFVDSLLTSRSGGLTLQNPTVIDLNTNSKSYFEFYPLIKNTVGTQRFALDIFPSSDVFYPNFVDIIGIKSGGDVQNSKNTLKKAITITHRSTDSTGGNQNAVVIDAQMYRPQISAVTRSASGVHHITSVNADNYTSIVQAGTNGLNPIHYSAYSQRDNALAFHAYKDATVSSGILNHTRNIIASNTTTFSSGFGFKTENYLLTSDASTYVNFDEETIVANVGVGTTTSARRFRHVNNNGGIASAYIMGLYASGVTIGNTTALPNTTTSLDLVGTTLGLGLNLVPTASLPTASTRKGNLLFDSTTNTLKVSDGTNWVTPLIPSGLTTNYLPYWNGSTFVNSNFFVNATDSFVQGSGLYIRNTSGTNIISFNVGSSALVDIVSRLQLRISGTSIIDADATNFGILRNLQMYDNTGGYMSQLYNGTGTTSAWFSKSVRIGDTTGTPTVANTATSLDLASTTKGIGLPLVPTASLPTASTRKGNLLFDSTANQLLVSNGTAWSAVSSASQRILIQDLVMYNYAMTQQIGCLNAGTITAIQNVAGQLTSITYRKWTQSTSSWGSTVTPTFSSNIATVSISMAVGDALEFNAVLVGANLQGTLTLNTNLN